MHFFCSPASLNSIKVRASSAIPDSTVLGTEIISHLSAVECGIRSIHVTNYLVLFIYLSLNKPGHPVCSLCLSDRAELGLQQQSAGLSSALWLFQCISHLLRAACLNARPAFPARCSTRGLQVIKEEIPGKSLSTCASERISSAMSAMQRRSYRLRPIFGKSFSHSLHLCQTVRQTTKYEGNPEDNRKGMNKDRLLH